MDLNDQTMFTNQMSTDKMPDMNELLEYLKVITTDAVPMGQVMLMNPADFYKTLGIPERVFRGEPTLTPAYEQLLQEQELEAARRRFFTNSVLMPLVDEMISSGVLPQPKSFIVHYDHCGWDYRPKIKQPEPKPLTALILLLAALTLLSLLLL